MPAILTHDFFGRDLLDEALEGYDFQEEERAAFLLGNQGPDPLFYLLISPKYFRLARFGSTMHSEKPNTLLSALKASINLMNPDEQNIALAYARGFICHYILDSHMHPLVYCNEYALCDAGVNGLSRKDGKEVHALIESEFDEMVLYAKRGKTIVDYAPVAHTLYASDNTLRVIGKMYVAMALNAYGKFVGLGMFPTAVRDFRATQAFFYSPTGAKRDLVSSFEQIFRPYSFYRAMSHRATALENSAFDNHEHATWENPFTHETDTRSFWDIFSVAKKDAKQALDLFDLESFDKNTAQKITGGLNFSGDPTQE